MDDTQSTDVGGTPSATPESTGQAAASVSHEESVSQAQSQGSVTAQPAAEGEQVEQEGATPPPSEDDPLKDIPSIDELQNQVQQKVPYAEALLRLRTALEARNGELSNLRPLESLKDVAQLGDAEVIKSRLETYDSLFTPEVNPETGQVELDEQGFEKITALPFIQRVDEENPGIAEAILNAALRYTPDRGDGQKIPLWRDFFKSCGLDPDRLPDYRNIDALTAKPSTDVTPEDLEGIPQEFHDVFKSLPTSVRDDLKYQDGETRRFNLEAHKERADRKAAETQQRQQAQEQRQAQEQQIREHVSREQESFVSQHLQEGYSQIMDDLASKVTFSEDSGQSAAIQSTIGALLFSLRDPDFRKANEARLAQMGVQLNGDFDSALSTADKHLRDAKAYELFGQKGFAQNSLAKARNARNEVVTKLAPIALRVAKAMGAQLRQRAAEQEKLLAGAGQVRPVPTGGGEGEEGILPPGMRANDPQAGIYLARRSGLLGGQ